MKVTPEIIRALRGKRTVEQFAQQFGVSQQHARDWESGKREPSEMTQKTMRRMIEKRGLWR